LFHVEQFDWVVEIVRISGRWVYFGWLSPKFIEENVSRGTNRIACSEFKMFHVEHLVIGAALMSRFGEIWLGKEKGPHPGEVSYSGDCRGSSLNTWALTTALPSECSTWNNPIGFLSRFARRPTIAMGWQGVRMFHVEHSGLTNSLASFPDKGENSQRSRGRL
jgi:hypothetical protein